MCGGQPNVGPLNDSITTIMQHESVGPSYTKRDIKDLVLADHTFSGPVVCTLEIDAALLLVPSFDISNRIVRPSVFMQKFRFEALQVYVPIKSFHCAQLTCRQSSYMQNCAIITVHVQ
jgi:hypothetical protein